MDVERVAIDQSYLTNTDVSCLAWRNVKVESKSWKSDLRPKSILADISGYAEAGMIFYLYWTHP